VQKFSSWAYAAFLVVAAALFGGSAQAADADYFPDDMELAVRVNLKQIISAELMRAQPDALEEAKAALGELAGVDAVQYYLKPLGLEALRDVRVVTYVWTGTTNSQPSFVILEGEFDSEKVGTAARGAGDTVKLGKAAEHTTFEIVPRGRERFHAAVVDGSTLIAASTEGALRDALDRRAGKRKSGLKKEVRGVLESSDAKQSITFVSTGAGFARVMENLAVPNSEKAVAFLKSQDAFSGGITLTQRIAFQLAFHLENDEAAKKLAESAKGALRMLYTLAQQQAEKDARYGPFVPILKGTRFTSEGTKLNLRVEMSLDTFEKLLESFPIERAPKERK
jgi:hypothetical protein